MPDLVCLLPTMFAFSTHLNNIETIQLIFTANELTGFYMRATLAFNRVNIIMKKGIDNDVKHQKIFTISNVLAIFMFYDMANLLLIKILPVY